MIILSFIEDAELRFAKRWISGVSVSDAISDARKANAAGELAMINYLGEDVRSLAKVRRTKMIYLELLRRMKSGRIRGCIAVKPTQLGLRISRRLFISTYGDIVRLAGKLGIFVWTDMEEYRYVDDIIDAYLGLRKKNGNVGICLQARLMRTYGDLIRVVAKGGVVRLVKGAYGNSRGVTYMTRDDVTSNYLRCMDYLLGHSSSFIVATHDSKIIEAAILGKKRYNGRLEFAMLKGVRPAFASILAKRGNDIYIYLPFGDDWLKYATRRLKEVSTAILLIRSLIGG